MDQLRRQVAALRADPAAAVLCFDFDGTLSSVVDDPDAAVASPGVSSLLGELASSYRRVAVLSGRPVAFLASQVPSSVDLVGLYGLETRIGGMVTEHPEAARWRPIVAEAGASARAAAAPGAALEGMRVEEKGLSITLHVRTRPQLGEAVVELASMLAEPGGLEVRHAKMSVELHPPIEVDKGTALRTLAAGAAAVLVVGDDIGDITAFDALATLSDPLRSGSPVATLAVAVGGPELPDELGRRADLVLTDQSAVVNLLEALLP